EFKKKMAAWPWELYLKDKTMVSFSISAAQSRLWHTGRLQEESLAAIQARLAAYGRQIFLASKKNIANSAEQMIFIRFERDRCQVSLDTSGKLLYQRGFDKYCEDTPLRETLANAILKAAAVERYRIVLDSFCGSGTLGLEAGLIFSGRPCNQNRSFAFENWPAFRAPAFQHLKEKLGLELKKQISPGTRKVYCSDISQKAVRTTTRNLEVMGLKPVLQVSRGDFFKSAAPAVEPGQVLLVLNPPYGIRLGTPEESLKLYGGIGEKIRRDFTGCGYAIIVPGLKFEKILSLAYDQKILFRNGDLPVALLIKHGNVFL
ncbi:MAG: hypothetical protein EHM45_08695, partial [Desulfobacteraceae bacterium]